MNFVKWFKEIDNKLFTALVTLMSIGFIITLAASPAVAQRISVPKFHFVEKQFTYLLIALCIIVILSSINERTLKKVIFLGFLATILMLVLVLIFGDNTKGAKRWLNIYGFSLQPSEILKPFYNAIVAMILARVSDINRYKVFCRLVMLHIVIVLLLLMQPDFGMTVLISLVFSIQLFIAQMKIIWMMSLGVFFIIGMLFVYLLFPHVAKRIEKFLASGDGTVNYQLQKSLESYSSGGLFGRGPGEGVVKNYLPDAHTDFIFPVAAEELGAIFCVIIISLIVYIVVKSFMNMIRLRYNLYKIYCGTGIISYFAIQSVFNIAVTLNLVPTKGMTLPFISYGGSSLIAQSILFGIYLNITKDTKKVGLKRKLIHAKL